MQLPAFNRTGPGAVPARRLSAEGALIVPSHFWRRLRLATIAFPGRIRHATDDQLRGDTHALQGQVPPEVRPWIRGASLVALGKTQQYCKTNRPNCRQSRSPTHGQHQSLSQRALVSRCVDAQTGARQGSRGSPKRRAAVRGRSQHRVISLINIKDAFKCVDRKRCAVLCTQSNKVTFWAWPSVHQLFHSFIMEGLPRR